MTSGGIVALSATVLQLMPTDDLDRLCVDTIRTLCVDAIRTLSMDAVLPPWVTARVSVEQASTLGWRYTAAARQQLARRA
jgi:hypothetical protein